MSKIRPSQPLSKEPSLLRIGLRKHHADYWLPRVFQNSYTRNGRLIKVNGWSVKIQYNGKRSSFSLTAETREKAAEEALGIYSTILNHGWAGVLKDSQARLNLPTASTPGEAAGSDQIPKTDPRYWYPRLIHRKYNEAMETNGDGTLSARIHHDGLAYYFPLHTGSQKQAVEKAVQIYRTVLKRGWDAAYQKFVREITVAVFWTANPLGYTYSTLFTCPAGEFQKPPEDSVSPRAELRVALVDGDNSVRRALTHWIGCQKGFRCVSCFGAGKEAMDGIRERLPELILVNRTLPDMLGQELIVELNLVRPNLPAFTYGVYEDSDQVYYSFSGVTAGYSMRRRPPTKLLEPIESGTRPYTKTQAGLQIQQYFQNLFRIAPTFQESPEHKGLTPRELEILDCVSKGYVDKEVATRLGISPWTVHGHLKNIYDKLRVRTRTEAVVKYLQK